MQAINDVLQDLDDEGKRTLLEMIKHPGIKVLHRIINAFRLAKLERTANEIGTGMSAGEAKDAMIFLTGYLACVNNLINLEPNLENYVNKQAEEANQ